MNFPALARYVAHIDICTDDDFHVLIAGKRIEHQGSITIEADSVEGARVAAVRLINEATLPWAKSWAVEDKNGRREGTYARQWSDLKGYLNERMREDAEASHWGVGGNQTLSVSIFPAAGQPDVPDGAVSLDSDPFGWYWEIRFDGDGTVVNTGFSRGKMKAGPTDLPNFSLHVLPLYRKR